MPRNRIIYADSDEQRLSRITGILAAAGYSVWPCSEDGPISTAWLAHGTPDLVLLGPGLDETLIALAAMLWPKVTVLHLDGSEDHSQLPQRIALVLSQRSTS